MPSAQEKLAGDTLFALVNNAGIGLAAKATPEEVLNTNLYGPKRMVEAFGPLLSPTDARIVNVGELAAFDLNQILTKRTQTGSGAGPNYVAKCPADQQQKYCTTPEGGWEEVESWVAKAGDGKTGKGSEADGNNCYGLSKCLLSSYTMVSDTSE